MHCNLIFFLTAFSTSTPVSFFYLDDESRRSLHQKRIHRLQRRPTRVDVRLGSDDPAEPLADELLVDCGILLEAGVVA